MILTDFNQTLHRPAEGFEVVDVRAEGAYLRVEFNRTKYVDDPTDRCTGQKAVGWDSVVLYLNDQGREVLRTEWFTKIAPPLPTREIPKPWYFKLADMFLEAINA